MEIDGRKLLLTEAYERWGEGLLGAAHLARFMGRDARFAVDMLDFEEHSMEDVRRRCDHFLVPYATEQIELETDAGMDVVPAMPPGD